MRTLIWGKTFVRAFKRTVKKHPTLSEELEKTLRLLAENPFDPHLETHKLKGKLSGSWACSVRYDLRIVFDFVKSETQVENVLIKGQNGEEFILAAVDDFEAEVESLRHNEEFIAFLDARAKEPKIPIEEARKELLAQD